MVVVIEVVMVMCASIVLVPSDENNKTISPIRDDISCRSSNVAVEKNRREFSVHIGSIPFMWLYIIQTLNTSAPLVSDDHFFCFHDESYIYDVYDDDVANRMNSFNFSLSLLSLPQQRACIASASLD